MPETVNLYLWKLRQFEREANNIFGVVESAKSRIVTLDDSYSKLANLSLKQDDLFRQSLRCVEVGVFRAAHVMAWAGMTDCLHAIVASDSFVRLNLARPNWQITSIEKLRDDVGEYNQIESFRAADLISKTERKALQGLLSKRNECAHPADYFPSYNETLGYIAEIFQRIAALQLRYPNFKMI